MKILIYYNPRSGKNKARQKSQRLSDELVIRGHDVYVLSSIEYHPTESRLLKDTLNNADRLVVIGGDGTVHHMLPLLIETRVPLYHVGTGTANLIAKEFGMSTKISLIVSHLEAELKAKQIDVPTCNGVPFLIMVSVGLDGSVIHRLEDFAASRRGYLAYIKPVIQELFQPRFAKVTVRSGDSKWSVSDMNGVVVSNLRSYGGGFLHSPKADPADDLLDAMSLRCRSTFQSAVQHSALFLRFSTPSMKRSQSEEFVIECLNKPSFVQIDGERASSIPGINQGVMSNGHLLRVKMIGARVSIHSPSQ